LTSSQYPVG